MSESPPSITGHKGPTRLVLAIALPVAWMNLVMASPYPTPEEQRMVDVLMSSVVAIGREPEFADVLLSMMFGTSAVVCLLLAVAIAGGYYVNCVEQDSGGGVPVYASAAIFAGIWPVLALGVTLGLGYVMYLVSGSLVLAGAATSVFIGWSAPDLMELYQSTHAGGTSHA